MREYLKSIISYLKTNDEGYLEDKRWRGKRNYIIENLLNSLNLPDETDDITKAYREGVLSALNEWYRYEEGMTYRKGESLKRKIVEE